MDLLMGSGAVLWRYHSEPQMTPEWGMGINNRQISAQWQTLKLQWRGGAGRSESSVGGLRLPQGDVINYPKLSGFKTYQLTI